MARPGEATGAPLHFDDDFDSHPGRAGSRFTAALSNPFMWLGERRGMTARRRALLADAHGDVLEIGAGTGLSLRHYPNGLNSLMLVEPAGSMADRIDLSRGPDDVPARLTHATAEHLPFADASFDTVVCTLVLCTATDPEQAMSEVTRVLRHGGRLLFCEDVAAPHGWRRWCQQRMARPWAAFADGCRCDRPTLSRIGAQLTVETVEHGRWRGMPAIVKPLVSGTAIAD